MKKLLLNTFLVLSLTSMGQNKNNHWEVANLKGNVKTSEITEYAIGKNGKKTKTGQMDTSFNEKGYISSMKIDNEFAKFEILTSFNEEGKPAESKTYNQMELVSTVQVKYNAQGKKEREITLFSNGGVFQQVAFQYDANGNELVRENCTTEDICFQKTEYQYNELNQLIAEITYNNSTKKITEKITHSYNDKNQKIESVWFDEKGIETQRKKYRYDKNNNEIEVKYIAPDGFVTEVITYTYLYDKKNNWTQKTERINKKVAKISKQKLGYF